MRFYDHEEDREEQEQGAPAAASLVGGGPMAAGSYKWGPYETVLKMASGNAVVVFSASGCCMCHVVKRLLFGLGVGPTVYEIDQMMMMMDRATGPEILAVLTQLVEADPASAAGGGGGGGVPAVFVGGKLLGGVEKVMACHINGSLVPLLKQAGALWL